MASALGSSVSAATVCATLSATVGTDDSYCPSCNRVWDFW
jgi:hypothetical protein